MFGFGYKSPQYERQEPVLNMAEIGGVTDADSSQITRYLCDVPPSDSGAIVNSYSSMRVSAVNACVRLICGAMGWMPKDIYQRDLKTFESTKLPGDPLWWILNEQACPQFTAATLIEYITADMLLRGDGFGYIVRDQNNRIQSIFPIPWSQIVPVPVFGTSPRQPAGIEYIINGPVGAFREQAEQIFHFPGFGFNGLRSMSVIQWGARNATGIAMRADEFAGKFFSQGAQPQIALMSPKKIGDAQAESLRQAFIAKYQGAGPNGNPLVLSEGITIEQLTMTMADAQLLESRKWQVAEIARAFGVPLHMIGETDKSTSWGTGIEQISQAFIDYTLGAHIGRFEHEANRKFFQRGPKFVRVNVDGLKRGDSAARAAYYKAAVGGTQSPAWMTPNEVRALENLPPRPDGNDLAKPDPAAPLDGGNEDGGKAVSAGK